MVPVTQITHSTPPAWVGNEYSNCSPFNADNTRLLLIKVDHFGLYDGDGNFLMDLPVPASAEPRWSRTDPNQFYFTGDSSVYSWRPSAITIVHHFPEYASISGRGESEISADGDHLVLCGTRLDKAEEVFVYTISTNTKGPTWVQTESFDGLKIDSQNRPILSKDSGIYVLGPTVKQLTKENGHAAVTRYKDRDKLLWCTSNDAALNKNAIAMIDVETGAIDDILHVFSWDLAFHISTCDKDWCLVSTDCPKRTLPSQIWKIFYDTSVPPELICNTDSIYTGYNAQVKAAASRDGSRLVGCSNFRKTASPDYCDVFLIKLANSQPVQTPLSTMTRIDYSGYVNKSRFIMVPRADGAVDIFEEKL